MIPSTSPAVDGCARTLIWVDVVPSTGVALGAISVGRGGSGVSEGGGVNDGGNVTVTMKGVDVAPLPS